MEGAPVVGRALLEQIAVLDHLLDVVGYVRAQVIAALGEFAHRQLLLADIEEDQGLNVVEVTNAQAVQLGLDHFKALAVQTLDQRYSFDVNAFHGTLRKLARILDFLAAREVGFRLLAGHRVEALTRTGKGTLESVVVIDADGARHELVTREVVVCAGAADSVLFCQQFARELGIEGHPLLGTRLHDHFSTPLFKVHAAGHRSFTDAYAPGFAGAFIVGRRLETEVGISSGWDPAGFLHFQYKFDIASPYREVKTLLDLRQRGGAIPKLGLCELVVAVRHRQGRGRRFQGIRDPAHDAIVLALHCTEDGIKGTYPVPFGPGMDALEDEMMRLLRETTPRE